MPREFIGGVLARQVLVARTDRFAVVVTRLVAYPLGFTLDVSTVARGADDRVPDMRPHPRLGPDGRLPEDMFRMGLLMSDGSRAVSYGGRPYPRAPGDLEALVGSDRPPEPLLIPQGGGGGGGRWDWTYWAAPLPPPGSLLIVVEWPAAHIPETSATLDAGEILAAAATARPVWDD